MENERERDIDPRRFLALLVILAFVTRVLAQVDDRVGNDYQFHTLILPVDVILAVVLVFGLRELPAAVRSWREYPVALAAFALGAFLVPALVAHPSDRGVAALFRWFGVCSAALLLARISSKDRRTVFVVLAVATAVSSVVAFGQRIAGEPIGLSALGESPDAVIDIGAPAVSGLLVHPYVMGAWVAVVATALAALMVSGRWRQTPATVGLLFVVAAPVGMSMARSAALAGVAAAVVLVVLAIRRRNLLPVIAVVVGFGVGALVNLGGWVERTDLTVTQTSASGRSVDVSAGRGKLIDQAQGLFEEDPILGVGPGRYVIALSERPDLVALSRQAPRPVHNVPILLVIEGGLFVLPGLLALVLAIGWATWRAGLPGLAVVFALLPFMLLDHLAWSFPQGLVLTGLWLGVLDLLARPASIGST